MTILSVFQEVAPVIGLNVPLSVYGQTDRELVELQALANSKAKEIAHAYDWQVLKKLASITGDGSTQDWTISSFASDFSRQLEKTNIRLSSQPQLTLNHILDSDDWLYQLMANLLFAPGNWTIYGGQMHIVPAIAAADIAKFFYISNQIVQPLTGTNKTSFTLDTDTFLLSERLLALGMIWQWKSNKGLPYAEDMETFEIAKQYSISHDKGSKILTSGRQRMPSGADVTAAWPGRLGT